VKVEAVRSFHVREGKLELPSAAPWLPALAAFAPVLGLAAAQGGYFPAAWGWASVPLFWAAAIALLVRRQVRLNTYERIFLVALVALVGWIALSVAWSVAPAESVLEIERGLVYVAAASAVLLLSRSRFARRVLGGLLAAISVIATFSLLTRLVPDRVGVYDRSAVYRLAQPIGYWNGLGLFAAMGTLIALGFAARARANAGRAAGGALLVVLLPTLYFTFGRAAWIALAIGLAAAVAVDPRRLQLLATLFVIGPAPAIAVFLASQETGLTHSGTPLVQAAHDGHRLAVILAFLMVGNAAIAAGLAFVAERVDVRPVAQRAFAVAVALLLAATAAAAFSRYGGPLTLADRGYTAFKAPPPQRSGDDLNQRLLSFSGNGRADLWGLAWDDAKRHSVLGAGAGTYERYFLAHQPSDVGRVRDAHGLYIETLAEVGPVGLALLIVVLLIPLATLRRARRHPLVPLAAGAYIAYLVHAGVDWDWELPAVTLAALLCGASILLFGRRWTPPRPLSFPTRLLAAGAAVAAALFAAIALLGNSALSRSETAREKGKPARAAADARRARTLMPWSPRPWEALGRAQVAAGLLPQARLSFRKAISMDRGDWRLWYDLAGASTGPAAHRALQHAVFLFPQSGLLPSAGKTRSRP
jgi:tetratricopeptide (TPR) repeat protein